MIDPVHQAPTLESTSSINCLEKFRKMIFECIKQVHLGTHMAKTYFFGWKHSAKSFLKH